MREIRTRRRESKQPAYVSHDVNNPPHARRFIASTINLARSVHALVPSVDGATACAGLSLPRLDCSKSSPDGVSRTKTRLNKYSSCCCLMQTQVPLHSSTYLGTYMYNTRLQRVCKGGNATSSSCANRPASALREHLRMYQAICTLKCLRNRLASIRWLPEVLWRRVSRSPGAAVRCRRLVAVFAVFLNGYWVSLEAGYDWEN
ncbi:hypothetical protein IQ07DRAFT_373861 [Pyrenochaeta sp. DS3sAY3a]|nr:hypothetical protein IQ07DRAFT_373861 [Pyrenochaeta sp. DS3sAY3a]